MRAQHTEGEALQGLEDTAAQMGCMGNVHAWGGRSGCKAHTGWVRWHELHSMSGGGQVRLPGVQGTCGVCIGPGSAGHTLGMV